MEIKQQYTEAKKRKVRQRIVPGNSRSLWRAVKHAKDMNSNDLPSVMLSGGVVIKTEDLADAFANIFETKISNLALNKDLFLK